MGIPDLVEGTCPAVACPAGAPISSRRNGGKERPGASFFEVASLGFSSKAPPAPSTPAPQTGAHGGGGLYGQGKDRACIAARPIGTYVKGAAAPRVARIGITL